MYNYNNFPKNQKTIQKAVALGYDPASEVVPKVLANGKGEIADMIMQIARENNIPIHENVDLVEILSILDIDDHIPYEVYSVVAEIFTYIYEQNSKKKIE